MAKIGRNEPCPCGSEKKYKKCCLGGEPATKVDYQRLNRTWHELMNNLMEFVVRELGSTGFELARGDFFADSGWEPSAANADELGGVMFWPWFFFNWYLEPEDLEKGDTAGDLPAETPPAQLYLERNWRGMNKLHRELCTAALHTPYSFREVVRVQAGSGLLCRDLFTGVEEWISEHQATYYAEPGEILYNKLIRVRGHSMIVGYAPIRIPQGQKPRIVRLRSDIRGHFSVIDEEALTELGETIRTFFLLLYSLLRQTPILTNNDGEDLSLRTMYFQIDSPQEAFDALHSLCCEQSRQELLSQAQLDNTGRPGKIRIPWSREKGGENPLGEVDLLGEIHIEGTSLTADVDSQPREEKLRREVEIRLGNGARYQGTEVTSQEDLRRQAQESPSRDSAEDTKGAPMDSPDVLEAAAEKIRAHWQDWIDTPLPALGGITPREAVRDSDGRESVEALLREGETISPGNGLHEAQTEGVQRARRELGLDGMGASE